MKRLLVALILLAMGLGPQFVMASADLTGANWLPGRLLVNFKESTGTLHDIDGKGSVVTLGIPSVDALLAKYQVTSMLRVCDDADLAALKMPLDLFRYVILMCPENTDVPLMMQEFERNPYVETADPDILYDMLELPNDPYWASQWDKRLMNTQLIWQFTTGSDSMIMVAIDGGTWWRHEDLYDNLWVNPGEDTDADGMAYTDTTYPGDQDDINGTDDDIDGKVDDLLGWDFIRSVSGCAPGEDCDSQMDNNTTSLSDHGTHVIGLMGARGGNEMGVAGQNWRCKVISCRAGYLSSAGEGRIVSSSATAAMTWAVGRGARVLNMSFGSTYNDPTEQTAITTLYNQGALFVGAAGNNGNTVRNYPGACTNVVCVGSVDQGNLVSDFSNRGTWVDCFAPGGEVMSLTLDNGYINMSGTSMASPNTAGIMALLWTLFPELTNTELVNLLLNHCRDISALNPGITPSYLGRGAVDAELILQSIFPDITLQSQNITGDNDGDGRLEPGESASLTVSMANGPDWSTGMNLVVQISCADPAVSITNGTFTIGSLEAGVAANNNASPAQIHVGTIPEPHWVTINIHVTSEDQPRYRADQSFRVQIGRPQILLVADDGGTPYRNYFSTGLMDTLGVGYIHDVWDVATQGDPTMNAISEYQYLVWECGNEATNTLTADNQALLAQWLNGGKYLLVAGQNINEDISATTFYSDYLHAQSVAGNGRNRLNGVADDPLSGGTTMFLMGSDCAGNNTSPSQITPANGGVSFFNYDQTGTCGAVRFSNGTYKVAYFAFAIEAACGLGGTTHYSVVLQNVMRWFGATPSLDVPTDHPAVVPDGFALRANYPNPFNPTTTVVFDVPRAANVSLKVFDLLGREVAELVNGRVDAGSHTAMFNAENLPSGTYIARMQTEGFSASERMMLVK